MHQQGQCCWLVGTEGSGAVVGWLLDWRSTAEASGAQRGQCRPAPAELVDGSGRQTTPGVGESLKHQRQAAQKLGTRQMMGPASDQGLKSSPAAAELHLV